MNTLNLILLIINIFLLLGFRITKREPYLSDVDPNKIVYDYVAAGDLGIPCADLIKTPALIPNPQERAYQLSLCNPRGARPDNHVIFI